MDTVSKWAMSLLVDEHDHQTHARARLQTRDNTLETDGYARLNPRDADVPEIGEELAVARALAEMAHRLLELTAGDIEAITHQKAALREKL
jgi:hypothetical protein